MISVRLLDDWLYRYPFEGASARRYANCERCGFGDLDDRLLDDWSARLAAAERLVDVGGGPGSFAQRVSQRFPRLDVIVVEPSRAYTRAPVAGTTTVRARAEALPLADDSVCVATMISVIRHVGDRRAALAELRRVVRPGGAAFVVELDPRAPGRRRRNHVRGMRSLSSQLAFTPLVLWTAPAAHRIEELARDAGWDQIRRANDSLQPVYILRLS